MHVTWYDFGWVGRWLTCGFSQPPWWIWRRACCGLSVSFLNTVWHHLSSQRKVSCSQLTISQNSLRRELLQVTEVHSNLEINLTVTYELLYGHVHLCLSLISALPGPSCVGASVAFAYTDIYASGRANGSQRSMCSVFPYGPLAFSLDVWHAPPWAWSPPIV